MTVQVTHEKLASISIFQDLSPETRSALAAHCRLVNLSPGAVLFEQGDTSRTLYLIEKGTVDIVREYEDGEKIVLAALGPNEVIGELSMLSNEPRTATVIAVNDVVLIALDRDVFYQYIGQYPSMAVEVLVQLSRRLQAMNLKVREFATNNAPARVASVLLFLAEEGSRVKTGLVTTNFRAQRIARAAGVDVDWLRDLLQEWSIEGYIGLDGRRLLLHDPDRLIEIAGWATIASRQ